MFSDPRQRECSHRAQHPLLQPRPLKCSEQGFWAYGASGAMLLSTPDLDLGSTCHICTPASRPLCHLPPERITCLSSQPPVSSCPHCILHVINTLTFLTASSICSHFSLKVFFTASHLLRSKGYFPVWHVALNGLGLCSCS